MRPSPLQTQYQAGLLKANAIVLTAVGLLVVYILDLGVTTPQAPISLVQFNRPATSIGKPADKTPPASPAIIRWVKPHPEHAGFAGFDGYRVVPDDPVLEVRMPRPFVTVRETIAVGKDTAVSFPADGDTPSFAAYVPEDSDYFLPELDTAPTTVVNREVEVIAKILPEIPWLARENEKGGYVEIAVYVDKDGRPGPYHVSPQDLTDTSGFFIDIPYVAANSRKSLMRLRLSPDSSGSPAAMMFLVLKEEPKEYGFADKLTSVLSQWVYRPRIRDNMPIGAFVRLGFYFCDPKKDPSCARLIVLKS